MLSRFRGQSEPQSKKWKAELKRIKRVQIPLRFLTKNPLICRWDTGLSETMCKGLFEIIKEKFPAQLDEHDYEIVHTIDADDHGGKFRITKSAGSDILITAEFIDEPLWVKQLSGVGGEITVKDDGSITPSSFKYKEEIDNLIDTIVHETGRHSNTMAINKRYTFLHGTVLVKRNEGIGKDIKISFERRKNKNYYKSWSKSRSKSRRRPRSRSKSRRRPKSRSKSRRRPKSRSKSRRRPKSRSKSRRRPKSRYGRY